MEAKAVVTAADGYADLGMADDAEVELSKLPGIELAEPAAVAVRMKLATLRGEWEKGEGFAQILEGTEGRSFRKACAGFHFAYARHLCGQGDKNGAGRHVREASELWPQIRMEMLEDPGLEKLWT